MRAKPKLEQVICLYEARGTKNIRKDFDVGKKMYFSFSELAILSCLFLLFMYLLGFTDASRFRYEERER